MKMKKEHVVVIVMVLALIAVAWFLLQREKVSEEIDLDVPESSLELPDYVVEQQTAIMQARELYFRKRAEGMNFESQCLGTVGENVKFVVDIVHIPRNAEDDRPENQCEDFRTGKVKHFIELDRGGNIFRIV